MPPRKVTRPESAASELELFDLEPPKPGRARTARSTRAVAAPQPPPLPVEDPEDDFAQLFPGAVPNAAISVSTLTAAARDVVEGAFPTLWVRGEVTGFKRHRNGHWYFTLRDELSQLRCVVWSRDARELPAPPDEGMAVAALGQLTVYPQRGDMQFSVRRLDTRGDGWWRKAMEVTRERLAADGLLAPERKRAIPRFPRCIAVVTSPDSAALHDIVAVVRKRAPGVRIVVVPATVQGDAAAQELCAAMQRLARWGGADTVIVGRGGGALEDLWVFNNERVARAIAACPVPTISAVGHEIDLTICDLVADLRAPTPSAAAEAAVWASEEMRVSLRGTAARLAGAMQARMRAAKAALRRAERHFALSARHGVAQRRAQVESIAGRLNALSPLATLARGYAVARGAHGETLTSVVHFTAGMRFQLVVRDGRVESQVVQTMDGRREGEEPA